LVCKRLLSYSGVEFNNKFKHSSPVILLSSEHYKQSLNDNSEYCTHDYTITTKQNIVNGYNFIEDRYGLKSYVADVVIPDYAILKCHDAGVFNSTAVHVKNSGTLWNTELGNKILNYRLSNKDHISQKLLEDYIQQCDTIPTVNIIPIIKMLFDNHYPNVAYDVIDKNKNRLTDDDMIVISKYRWSARRKHQPDNTFPFIVILCMLSMSTSGL